MDEGGAWKATAHGVTESDTTSLSLSHLFNSSLKCRKKFYLNQDVRGDRKRQGQFYLRSQKPKDVITSPF